MIDWKHLVDTVSVSTVVATLVGWLPHLAALASLVWTVIRIYETTTIQQLVKRRKRKARLS